MSIGEDRVRLNFNPSKDLVVDQIKRKTAELIDLCHEQSNRPTSENMLGENKRVWALAMTKYEDACHWAVKGATAP